MTINLQVSLLSKSVIMGINTIPLLLSFIFIHSAVAAHDLSREYRFSAEFAGGDYLLYWNVALESKVISFAVDVATTGWVGFGISPNGQMPGSDVVIAWVDNNGRVSFSVSSYSKSTIPVTSLAELQVANLY